MKFLSRVKLFKYRFKFEERIIKLFDNDFINISDTFRILEKSVDSSDLDFYVDLSGFGISKIEKYKTRLKVTKFSFQRDFINSCKFYSRV